MNPGRRSVLSTAAAITIPTFTPDAHRPIAPVPSRVPPTPQVQPAGVATNQPATPANNEAFPIPIFVVVTATVPLGAVAPVARTVTLEVAPFSNLNDPAI